MTKTVALHTRTQIRSPSGAGEKVVRGTVNITPGTSSLRATDVNLKTIRNIQAQSRNEAPGGTLVRSFVNTPGTFDNSASFYVTRARTVSGSLLEGSGAINAGTHLIDFVVFGD